MSTLAPIFPDRDVNREWLITDGLGGYASSTLINLNTRKYHGLWVPAVKPPAERWVMLNQLEEVITPTYSQTACPENLTGDSCVGSNVTSIDGKEAMVCKGDQFLTSFSRNPFPCWIITTPHGCIKKEVIMIRGIAGLFVRYINIGQESLVLHTRPWLSVRNQHHLHDKEFILKTQCNPNLLHIHGQYPFNIYVNQGSFIKSEKQLEAVYYRLEEQLGYPAEEHQYSAGYFEIQLSSGKEVLLFCGYADLTNIGLVVSIEQERKRLISIQTSTRLPSEYGDLAVASEQFVVSCKYKSTHGQSKPGCTIMAGYPWFADWGRDALIALPGLLLIDDHLSTARDVLDYFSAHINKGVVPNFIGHKSAYNSVDASLWFVQAVYHFIKTSNDLDYVEKVLPVIDNIIEHYHLGTHFGIKVDSDGLLTAGIPGNSVTWMDAVIDDETVTPRYGKTIEINALWYNLLKCTEWLASLLHIKNNHGKLADKLRRNIQQSFWDNRRCRIIDCINGENKDFSCRPNQILAVGLPYSIFNSHQEKAIVRHVTDSLLTPYGLRTLDPRDTNYIGHYAGNITSRDQAYHQGTAWPWFIGFYSAAYLKVNNYSPDAHTFIRNLLKSTSLMINEYGVGTIGEIFDGDPPHTPRGCIAQAWSVGEIMRAIMMTKTE